MRKKEQKCIVQGVGNGVVQNKNMTKQNKDLWHYLRECEHCEYVWEGIHCKHEKVQNPCPDCGKIPKPVKGKCYCVFDA